MITYYILLLSVYKFVDFNPLGYYCIHIFLLFLFYFEKVLLFSLIYSIKRFINFSFYKFTGWRVNSFIPVACVIMEKVYIDFFFLIETSANSQFVLYCKKKT